MNEKVTKLQKVTKKLHFWNQYITIYYYNCNFVTYINYTPKKKIGSFMIILRGGICRKKSYKVTKSKKATKYGFQKQQICNLVKSYKNSYLTDIGIHWFSHFYRKVTFKSEVINSIIIGGVRYYHW